MRWTKIIFSKKSGLLFITAYVLLLLPVFIVSREFSVKGTEPLLLASLALTINLLLYKNQKNYVMCFATVIGVFLSVLYIAFKGANTIAVNSISSYIAFCTVLACTIIMLSEHLKRFKNKSPMLIAGLLFFTLTILTLPLVVVGNYYILTGTWFGSDAIMAVLQTNQSETIDYLAACLDFKNYFFTITMFAVIFYLIRFLLRIKLHKSRGVGVWLLILAVIVNASLLYKFRITNLTKPFEDAQMALKEYELFEENLKIRKSNISESTLELKSSSATGVYVLVIGESQNKKHMSAYGYARPTTPWLQSMVGSNNFVLFGNAYSCHTHTAQALTYALSAKNQYNDGNIATALSLLEVAGVYGYDTVWISNQAKYGIYDTPITTIANSANQQYWYSTNYSSDYKSKVHDLNLNYGLDTMQVSDKMLIVIHLMGSHGDYKDRYPKEFRQYKGSGVQDIYDNSILYNDFVMQSIYNKVKQLPNFQAMIYFADHSEDVERNLGHDSSRFTADMTRIPMYTLFSDRYIDSYPDKVRNLKVNKDKPFTNDLIFDYVLGMLDIKERKVYEPDNDITGGKYDGNAERFRTMWGKRKLEY